MTDTRESPAPSRAPLEQREEVSAQLAELEYLLREDPSPKRRRAAVLECAAAIRAAYPDERAAALTPVESGTPEPWRWAVESMIDGEWEPANVLYTKAEYAEREAASHLRVEWPSRVVPLYRTPTPASGRAGALEAVAKAASDYIFDWYGDTQTYMPTKERPPLKPLHDAVIRLATLDQLAALHPDPEKEG